MSSQMRYPCEVCVHACCSRIDDRKRVTSLEILLASCWQKCTCDLILQHLTLGFVHERQENRTEKALAESESRPDEMTG